MKIIRIALTPLEPYFFGNDKNLRYDGVDRKKTKAISYYAISEKTPSQSTLFGVLRYLGLSKKSNDYSISEKEKQNIGGQSFRLLEDEKKKFGRIIRISNLYLMSAASEAMGCPEYYVRMPFDHNCKEKDMNYRPFQKGDYKEVVTGQGRRMLPVQYKVKDGFADGYVNLKDGSYVKDEAVFTKVEKLGIQVDKEVDGYYKRVSFGLKKQYSFAYFAYVEDDFYLSDETIVYMGYGKSTFLVNTHELEKEEKQPSDKLLTNDNILPNCTKRVALSDIYIKDSLMKLYQCCVYVNTQSREYREFFTNYGSCTQQKRFQRGTHYIHLIKAGSVFYVENSKLEIFDSIVKNENAEIAGFNQMTGDDKG